jgi:hypothetical protein
VFNFGLGEITVLVLLAIIFFGPKRLSELGESLRQTLGLSGPVAGSRGRAEDGWSAADWALVALTVVLGAAAFRL